MKKIALIVNFDKSNALTVANNLIDLIYENAEVFCKKEDSALLTKATPVSEEELFKTCGVVAVLGGDGTIIATAKKCAPFKNILVGINVGNLGYLSTIESSNLESATTLLLGDDIHFDERYMLCVRIFSGGKEISSCHALNEIVLSRTADSKLINFSAYSEKQNVCQYRADGMIVATPTGSTAYSLSAGGPIVSPDADAMLITPICPHTLRARSIVLPPKLIKIVADSPSELSVDGQMYESLENGDYITVEKSPYVARLVHSKDLSFYDILQKKL